MKLIEQMGSALAHAHNQRIVHADFKPGNIFLTDDDTVKVNHHDDADDDAMDTSDDAKKFKNRLSDADLDKFLIVSRSVGTFARALDCSSSVKQPRYSDAVKIAA